jgi:hypothetical protein
LTLQLAESRLSLPCSTSHEMNNNPALAEFDPKTLSATRVLRSGRTQKTIKEDPETGIVETRIKTDYGHLWHRSCDTEVDFTIDQRLSIHPDDPNSARSETALKVKMTQGKTKTALNSHYEMTSSQQHYFVRATWQAWADDECIFERKFDEKIERMLI